MSFAADSLQTVPAGGDFAHRQHQGQGAPARPTRTQRFLAEYRNPVIGGTVASHFAHHQYLTKIKGVASRRHFAVAGAAWAVAYAGVLSTTTIAEAKVHKSSCPVEAERRR